MFSTQQIVRQFSSITLKRQNNQANELAKYAIDFIKNGKPSDKIINQLKLVHTDSILCGVAALALKTNIPSILKNEAFQFSRRGGTPLSRPKPGYAKLFGLGDQVPLEKAIAANVSAVSELEATAEFFGYHSDNQITEVAQSNFLPIVITAAHQNSGMTGEKVVRAMILLGEIQSRLCEAIPLSSYNIDHVFNGAIASLITYGAIMGATPVQIEHAIGLFCAHSLPSTASREGQQLTDSVGAASAISAELAISAMKRSLEGFSGPSDIFRSSQTLFRGSKGVEGESSFDIVLGQGGNDFSITNYLFKIGVYNQHAASAIEATLRLLKDNNFVGDGNSDCIEGITIIGSKDTFRAVGHEDRKFPGNRHSATNSVYYLGKLLLILNTIDL